MLKFQKITADSAEIIRSFLEREGVRLCEYTFGVKYMWKDVWDSEYAVFGETLVFKENYEDDSHAFYYPLGKADEQVFLEIEKYARIKKFALEFLCVPDEKVSLLKERYGGDVLVVTKRDWADYLYDAEEMKTFPGKKFAGQRNHLNKFNRLYGAPEFHEATEADLPMLREFFKEYMEQSEITDKGAMIEAEHAYRMLGDAFGLKMKVGYVRAAGRTVAFAIGERVGDTLFVHIEKALYGVDGAYQAIVTEFAKAFAVNGVKFINREDDSGDEGLRISKTRYNPVSLLSKNLVRVDNRAECVHEIPHLESRRLVYDRLTPADMPEYRALNLDDENNRWWGYDYREDLAGREPTCAYFYEMVEEDFQKREVFCFAAREKGGSELVGEGVLYDFKKDFSCEIGARIFPRFRGRGYGAEIFARMKGWAEELGFSTVRAKRYRQNAAAEKMILKSGMTPVSEDGTFVYYEWKKPDWPR